jgi:hypothetical protein
LQRRLTPRRPNAPSQRLQQIAAFIEKYHASLTFEALFLSAAIRRGSNERSRAHCVHEHVVPAFADSSRACGANAARNAHGTRLRTIAESSREPAAPSIPMERNPRREFPGKVYPPARVAAFGSTWVSAPGGALGEACSRDSTPFASDEPTKCSIPRPRQLPSMSFPARTIGPRSSDAIQAIRDFRMVSFRHCNGTTSSFH